MSDLRKKLIRLAHQKPHLRGDLLPLIQKTAYWKPPRKLTKTFAKQVAKYIKNTIGKPWLGGVNGTEELKLQDVRNGISKTIISKMSMSDMISYQFEVKRWVDSLSDDDLRTLVGWVYDVWYKGSKTWGYEINPQRIKSAYGMKSVAKFYTLAEAVAFVESYKHDNVRIEKELDGRFHVYDMK